MSILSVSKLSVAFGGIRAVDGVSFEVAEGTIFSIIGPNGAGKTTLFNLLSGLYRPAGGRVLFDGEEVTGLAPHLLARRGMSRTFQNLQIFFRMTALENVMAGAHRHETSSLIADLIHLPASSRQNAATEGEARRLLAEVGLAAEAEAPAGALPYGALKRLEIARALASRPRLLLLDEPAAGCNAVETQEIDALIHRIAGQGVTVLLVEHDMRLVMRISDRVLVLDHGQKLAEGEVDAVRTDPAVIAAYLGTHGQEDLSDARRR